MGESGRVMANVSFVQRWVKPEVYPLFAAIGAGIVLCGSYCGRLAFVNPDVFLNKTHRSSGEPYEYYDMDAYGRGYRNHSIRTFFQGHNGSVFGGLNDAMSGKVKSKYTDFDTKINQN